jgi:hypothetical protein
MGNPNWPQGKVPTPAEWNAAFAAKQDVLGYTPLPVAGGTLTGELVTVASTTATAGLNLPHGVAPSAPVNGDLWTTPTSVFARVNGTTITLGSLINLTLAGPLTTTGTGPVTFAFPNVAAVYTFPASSGTLITAAVTSLSGGTGAFTVASPVTVSGTNVLGLDASFFRGYIAGLNGSSGGGNQIVSVLSGVACSDDFTTLMKLSSNYTKTFAAWTVGSGVGGLDTGAIAGNTWYHIFLIQRLDTGVVDILISLSATTPTMPANYTVKRRIMSIRTDAGPNVLAFSQNGDEFIWSVAVQDISTGTLGSSATLFTLASIPTGFKVNALLRCSMSNATTAVAVLINSPDESVQVANSPGGNANQFSQVTNAAVGFGMLNVRTNTSAQVRAVSTAASTTLFGNTVGFIDTRGRSN